MPASPLTVHMGARELRMRVRNHPEALCRLHCVFVTARGVLFVLSGSAAVFRRSEEETCRLLVVIP
jgi:hypothetical protein